MRLVSLEIPRPPPSEGDPNHFPFSYYFFKYPVKCCLQSREFQLSQLISIFPCALPPWCPRGGAWLSPLSLALASDHSFYLSLLLLFQNQIYIINLFGECLRTLVCSCGRRGLALSIFQLPFATAPPPPLPPEPQRPPPHPDHPLGKIQP